MGVDINLWLEIQKEERWRILSFGSPVLSREEDDESLPGRLAYYRYYHFERFLDKVDTCWEEHVTDLSEEAKRYLGNDAFHFGYGVFSLEDLAGYCEEARNRLLQSLEEAGYFRLERRIGRIEEHLGIRRKGRKDVLSEDVPEYYPLVNHTVREIVERFEDSDDGMIMRFHEMVRALVRFLSVPAEDVRIFFVTD